MTNDCHSEECNDEESDEFRYFIPNKFGLQFDNQRPLNATADPYAWGLSFKDNRTTITKLSF